MYCNHVTIYYLFINLFIHSYFSLKITVGVSGVIMAFRDLHKDNMVASPEWVLLSIQVGKNKTVGQIEAKPSFIKGIISYAWSVNLCRITANYQETPSQLYHLDCYS